MSAPNLTWRVASTVAGAINFVLLATVIYMAFTGGTISASPERPLSADSALFMTGFFALNFFTALRLAWREAA